MPKAQQIVPFPASTVPQPPADLQEAGRRLWRGVMEQYVIEDTHQEQSADSAAAMREQIKREGATVIGSTGQPAAHPLIACEGAAQKRVAQFLKQIGLFDEALARLSPQGRKPFVRAPPFRGLTVVSRPL